MAKGEYAFDNPAFRTEQQTNGSSGTATTTGNGIPPPGAKTGSSSSPLDPSWSSKQNTIEKRKTVDDSYVNVSVGKTFQLPKRIVFL